jgi:serine/threonine protein kinase
MDWQWSMLEKETDGICLQILHRDMKAANVFIHKDEFTGVQAVKIGDLGVAKLLNSNTCFATTVSPATRSYLDRPYPLHAVLSARGDAVLSLA